MISFCSLDLKWLQLVGCSWLVYIPPPSIYGYGLWSSSRRVVAFPIARVHFGHPRFVLLLCDFFIFVLADSGLAAAFHFILPGCMHAIASQGRIRFTFVDDGPPPPPPPPMSVSAFVRRRGRQGIVPVPSSPPPPMSCLRCLGSGVTG